MASNQRFHWWQKGIIYEVYVRSFQDSNGDGVGDLRGIIQRLDYLQWLGVTAIWLTPVYPSPMKDFGYDISDYRDIHSLFGTLADFDLLLDEVHRRDMKLIMDLVPNHTSDQHPWFLESRSSKDNAKRDWYYWKDGKEDGSAPNNWLSVLGGPAWEWDEQTGQYYYHAFLKEQPDLNMRNPKVVQAVLDIMQFWLDRGVDGFRIDVIWHLIKDAGWRDNPVNPHYEDYMQDCDRLMQIFSCDQPEVHDIIRQMRTLTDTYKDRMLIGEIYLPVDKIVVYYGKENNGTHLPANFQLMFANWKADEIALLISQYEAVLPEGSWPNWVIGNHDRPRLIDRIGAGQARIAALLLLTLRGTPILYYGDELGMEQVYIPEEEVQDPQGILMPGKNLSRDPARTPMQWDSSDGAGFTTGTPWLRIAANFKAVNVAAEQNQEDSLLHFYKRLISLRQSEPSLSTGDYRPVYADGQIISFIRKQEGADAFLIIANLTGSPAVFKPEHMQISGTVVLAALKGPEGITVNNTLEIDGNQGIIIRIDKTVDDSQANADD